MQLYSLYKKSSKTLAYFAIFLKNVSMCTLSDFLQPASGRFQVKTLGSKDLVILAENTELSDLGRIISQMKQKFDL